MNLSKQKNDFVYLQKRRVNYSVRPSQTAQRARIKVSSAGVEVVVPQNASSDKAASFLRANSKWVLNQLDFVKRIGSVRKQPISRREHSILFHGKPTRVEIITEKSKRTYGVIDLIDGHILIRLPNQNSVDPAAALESWLRKQAKVALHERIKAWAKQMRQRPGRVYVMGQRTKWGGCSRRRNLSFNWRLIMAPPEVLDYIVVHELAHLAEPYHSTKFWLIVRSYCPEFERRRVWLREHEELMRVAL